NARSSRPSRGQSIVAPSPRETSRIATSNPELYYRLEANDQGFFQTAVSGPASAPRTRTQRIDLVIGSGKKGQTFLWGRGGYLFALPLWYSPRRRPGRPGPPILDPCKCVDCHMPLEPSSLIMSVNARGTTQA